MNRTSAALLAAAALVATAALAKGGAAYVVAKADAKWADAGIPGVQIATVEGASTGASHFFLKYPAGFVTPLHHHTADHYVTTLSGTLVLVVDKVEHRLAPGSFFSLTGGMAHVARCEGAEACVMSIDARAAWDVVPEPAG